LWGVRGIVVLLYLAAAAVALLLLALALIYVVAAGWVLWEHQIAATGILLVFAACTGGLAIRVLIALRNSFIRWRRRCQAERDLPWATVVSR
jgi:hypothetical protein